MARTGISAEFIEEKADVQKAVSSLEPADAAMVIWRKDGLLKYAYLGDDQMTVAVGMLAWAQHKVLCGQFEDDEEPN